MAVSLSLFLFGKPGQELEEGEEVTAQQLRDLGQHLQERLQEIAAQVDKLTSAGWDAQMCLYDVNLSHPYIDTEAQAVEKLQDLGLDPEKFLIQEWEDEEWKEEDEEMPNA